MSYWKYKCVNQNWVNIWCPTLHDVDPKIARLPFSTQKQVLKDFKELENKLKIDPMAIGWVSWTGLQHQHIMIALTKMGANPYQIDTKLKDFGLGRFYGEVNYV